MCNKTAIFQALKDSPTTLAGIRQRLSSNGVSYTDGMLDIQLVQLLHGGELSFNDDSHTYSLTSADQHALGTARIGITSV